jgi:hypothetical protein
MFNLAGILLKQKNVMKHNLELNDAVLVTEESIALINKAEKERELPVHSSTFDGYGKNSPLKYFCYYQGFDEDSPSIGRIGDGFETPFNVLSIEEFEKKLFSEKVTIYVPEGRTPVFTYKAKDGVVVDFVKKIDLDKITTGSIVKLKHTDNICWSHVDFDKSVTVVYWKTPHFINDRGNVLKKGYHKSYATFIQDGKFILFSTDDCIDFIKEVITY